GDDLTARGVVGEPEDRGKLVLAAGGFGEHAPGFWGVLRCRGRSGRFLRCRRGGRGARERTGPVRPGGPAAASGRRPAGRGRRGRRGRGCRARSSGTSGRTRTRAGL